VPPLEGGVLRERLLWQLDAIRAHKLALICAPAGSGKTTLLTQWAHADIGGRSYAWVTLEEQHNDPIVFWREVFNALRSVVNGLSERAWANLSGSSPALADIVVPDLLNDLTATEEEIVLILDDYQLIENDTCHATLRLLLDYLPRSAHVVVASRAKPNLLLARLRSKGSVIEIGPEALAFTLEEAREAFAGGNATPSDEDVIAVLDRNEGWAMGVYLASRAGNSAGSAGGGIHPLDSVREHMLADMLAGQSNDHQEFLIQTSILEDLNTELCNHVTRRDDSAQLLRSFSHSNVPLMTLSLYPEVYRYHQLLQEVLSDRLYERDGDLVRELHRRAHEWYLRHGHISPAIHHAIDAGDKRVAADLICGHWSEMLASGRLETASSWLRRLSDDDITSYPPLIVTAAWDAAFHQQPSRARRLRDLARQRSFRGPPPDGAASYESSIALLSAGLFLDGVTAARADAEVAYALEPIGSPMRPLAAVLVGVTRAANCELDLAMGPLLEAAAARSGPAGIAAYALGQLAIFSMWNGQWDDAESYAERSIARIEELGIRELFSSAAGYVAAASVAAQRRATHDAAQRLQDAQPAIKALSGAVPFNGLQIHTALAEVYLQLGDPETATRHVETAQHFLQDSDDECVAAERLRAVLTRTEPVDVAAGLTPEPPDTLSIRERQVLKLLAGPFTLREIGAQLYVSRNTVKSHVTRIYSKLGVKSRQEALARARELGIEDQPAIQVNRSPDAI
jgi:LuxR family maltose regulon positive regulatory protein